MSMFGFGSSQSSNRQQSSSQSQSSNFGLGFSQSGQNVWDVQAPFLQDLFSQGQQTLQGIGPIDPTQQANQAASLFGGMAQGSSPGMQALQGIMSPDFYNNQLQGVASDLLRNFENVVNPDIRASAIAAGQGLGGDRQQVLQAQAHEGMQHQLGQAALGFQQQQGQAANLFNQAQLGALSNVNQVFQPYQAAFGPLMQYANMLGGPTVLGQSQSGQMSGGQSSSTSQSSGRGSSSSFNFSGGSMF